LVNGDTYVRKLSRNGTWQRINDALRIDVRLKAGREAEPSLGIGDSRSKRPKKGPRGWDGGKRVSGRKRHLHFDTLGLLLRVLAHPADWQGKRGLRPLLLRLPCLRRLKHMLLDGTYRSEPLRLWGQQPLGLVLELVLPVQGQKGFALCPSAR
jgi:putative transposase